MVWSFSSKGKGLSKAGETVLSVFSESKITSFILEKEITIGANILLNVFGVIDPDDAYHYCHHSWDNTFPVTFEQAVSGICIDLNALMMLDPLMLLSVPNGHNFTRSFLYFYYLRIAVISW